jgi:hypothetical protein
MLSFVGSDGSNIPNRKRWYQDLNFKTKTVNEDGESHYKPTKVYNVNSLIICAMAATLEVYFWTQSKRMSEKNLVTYQYLIDNARRHIFHLKALCTNILSIRLSSRRRSIDRTVSYRPAVVLR